MKKTGKTLFFNESNGNGIIITSTKEKINFTVSEWDDYEIMPSKGLEVVFDFKDNIISNILSKESFTQEEKDWLKVFDSFELY